MDRPVANPFWYGASAGRLVDRDPEVAAVVHTLTNAGRLLLLGWRRFGKSSVLEVAAEEVAERGVAVLRYDAEAYETIASLARAMAAGATQVFAGSLDRSGEIARRFFAAVRATASYDLTNQRLSIDFNLSAEQHRRPVVVLTAVLDGIEQLAATHGRPTAVILDEFQEVIIEGGERASHEIRAAINSHRYVGYVFAGSQVRRLTEMASDPSRPFWKLGDLRFLGGIPRSEFRPFVRRGLESAGAAVDDAGIERLLDLAADVPFNIQWLGSMCWHGIRLGQVGTITAASVDGVLDRLVDAHHAMYVQTWINLTSAQRRTLKAIAGEAGDDFRLTEVAGAHALAPSTMQRTLAALEERSLIRQVTSGTGMRWCLGDPFFARWSAHVQATA
jgi:hypothetical protein